MKILPLAASLSLILASPAWAKKIGRGSLTETSTRTSIPAPGADLRTRGVPEVTNSSDTVVRCDDNNITGNAVSLAFLHTIIDYPQDMRVVLRGNSAELIIPRYISACTKLDFQIVSKGNNVFVKAVNEYEFTPANTDLNEDQLSIMSMDDKYYHCMKKKGLITSDDNIDREKAESLPGAYSGGASKSFSVDLGDRTESKYIVFGSPKNTSYGSLFPNDEINSNPGARPSDWKCMAYENLKDGSATRIYTSEEDQAMTRAYRACNTEDYEEIYNELIKLKNSTVGNAKELIAVLERALDDARTKEMDSIFKKMEEIEDSLKKDEQGNMPSEDFAKEQAQKYLDLVKRLNYVVLQPSIQKLNELLSIRNEENKGEVDKKIKALNELISKYYIKTKDSPRFLTFLQGLKEYALTEQAYGIEGVRLTSKFYGQVYKEKQDKRGANLSLKQADEYVVRDMKKYETEVLADWNNDYLSRQGNKSPIASTEREMRKRAEALEREKQAFLKREQEMEKRLCGRNFFGQVSDPYACQSFLKNRGKRLERFQKKRERGLLSLRSLDERRGRYVNNYTNYLERRELEDDSDDYYGGIEEFYYGSRQPATDMNFGGMNMNMFNMGQNPYMMQNPFGMMNGGMPMIQGPGMMNGGMQNPYGMMPQMYQQPMMGFPMMGPQMMYR
ncbi:MAG: hypothetical protein Fur0010_07000 [Bdellovibrio sp.]